MLLLQGGMRAGHENVRSVTRIAEGMFAKTLTAAQTTASADEAACIFAMRIFSSSYFGSSLKHFNAARLLFAGKRRSGEIRLVYCFEWILPYTQNIHFT